MKIHIFKENESGFYGEREIVDAYRIAVKNSGFSDMSDTYMIPENMTVNAVTFLNGYITVWLDKK